MIVWRRRRRKIEQTGEVNRSGEQLEVWRNVAGGKYGAVRETDVISLLMLGVEEIGVVDDDGRWQRARISDELRKAPYHEQIGRMEPWSFLARHAITDVIEHGEPTPRHRQLVQDFAPAEAAKEREADIQDCVAHSAYMLGLIEITTSDPCRDPELADLAAARRAGMDDRRDVAADQGRGRRPPTRGEAVAHGAGAARLRSDERPGGSMLTCR